MEFKDWLKEQASLVGEPTVGIGGGGIDTPDDDDDDDDDDYENGPWGWKKLEKFNLKLHEWAKSSPAVQQIKNIICKNLFEKQPFHEENRVFPAVVQVEVEWELDVKEWTELDDQIESVLKRSDLWRPLGLEPKELWNVVDKGAVYNYVYYVIAMSLSGRNVIGGVSQMDKATAFAMYNWLREDWATLEKSIRFDIEAQHWPNDKHLQISLDLNGRGFSKPQGLSQWMGAEKVWAKGIAMIPYSIKNGHGLRWMDPDEDEEYPQYGRV